jgi:hypothetical protein
MSVLIYPDGVVRGCLPRRTLVGDVCPRLEERIAFATEADYQKHIKLPLDQTLLRCVRSIFSQGNVGSCATESSTAAIQLVREFNGLDFEQLSPWSMYAFTSGGRDRGSSIDENLRHLQTTGVLTMDEWSRDEHDWNEKPSDALLKTRACRNRISEFFDITDIEGVMTALTLNMPVVFGWQGHSCVLLKLASMTTAYYLNSWGSGWSETGMPGIGKINLRSIGFHYGAFAVRSCTDSGETT